MRQLHLYEPVLDDNGNVIGTVLSESDKRGIKPEAFAASFKSDSVCDGEDEICSYYKSNI
jgi:hypothetical protein